MQHNMMIDNNHVSDKILLSYMAAMFVSIFTLPPRMEAWTLESARAFIINHFSSDGDSLFINVLKNRSLAASLFGCNIKKSSVVNEAEDHTDIPFNYRVFYISTIMIDSQFRREGLACELVETAEKQLRLMGYEYIVARTRTDLSGAMGLFNKKGYTASKSYPSLMGGESAFRTMHYKKIA